MAAMIATPDRIAELLAEGLDAEKDAAEMARRLGIHRDSLRRAFRRRGMYQIGPGRPVITEEQEATIRRLGEDGVIGTWICESADVNASTVRRRLGNRPEVEREWRPVWQEIRRNEELLELHRQIAAPSPKNSYGRRPKEK